MEPKYIVSVCDIDEQTEENFFFYKFPFKTFIITNMFNTVCLYIFNFYNNML